MSALIHAFFVEPVFRQARRFSNARLGPTPPNPEPAAPFSSSQQSHANTTTQLHSDNAGRNVTITQHAAITDSIPGLQLPDRFVPTLERPVRTDPPLSPPPAIAETSPVPYHDETRPTILENDADTLPTTITHASCAVASSDSGVQPVHAIFPSIEVLRDDVANIGPSTPHSLVPSAPRTSSARDIPRAQMSLRSDSPSASGSLPADDGMRLLRAKIHDVRELRASTEEKARRMHEIMTEEWQAAQMAIRPHSPASMTSQEPMAYLASSPLSTVTTPASPSSTASMLTLIDPTNPYNIHPEDLQPSYRPLPDPAEQSTDDSSPSDEQSSDALEPALGCKHYKRNVKIQCFDCKEWHSCRHCHDAAVTSHHLNRSKTENMLCMLCWTPQPAAQYCRDCGEHAAWYYCDICKLWDDDASKRIYHCADCGICRRGEGLGKDYVHCKKCNVCISISHFATHTCIENATDSNCPLCLDYMFTSPLEIVAMPCGHYLHHHCYTSLMTTTYQCPICKRSAVNMETQWRKLDEEIRNQPMPREWSDIRVETRCNDCGGVSIAPYHWLGLKCGRCDGFNTVQIRLLAAEDVQRGVQDFAEQRRERRAEERGMGREIRRTVTAPVTVRPYFLDDEDVPRPGSSDGFAFPELPRLPEFNVRNRLPDLPNMPSGFNPFEMLGRVGRSLSPIRHYFDDQIAEGVPRRFMIPRDGDMRTSDDGWASRELFLVESSDEENRDEDGEEEYDSEDFEDSESESGSEWEDEDEDEEHDDVALGEGDRLNLNLTGHR